MPVRNRGEEFPLRSEQINEDRSINNRAYLWEDPEDVFGKHAACQLRSLASERERDYLKFKFEELIFQVKFHGIPTDLNRSSKRGYDQHSDTNALENSSISSS